MKIFTFVAILIVLGNTGFSQEKKEEFKPSWKVWAYSFGDYFYKVSSDTAKFGTGEFSKTGKDYQAFTFRRVYLGLDYAITKDFSGQVLLEGSDVTNLSSSDRGVFIKAAYIEWKNLIPQGSIIIGQSPTPTWSTLTEKVWSYRSIEKTITDFRGLGGSNDLGIAVNGTFDKKNDFSYYLMFGNGRGSKPENNKLKKYYGELTGRFLDKKLIVDVYADYQDDDNKPKSKTTLKGFLGYQTEKFTAGIEGLQQIQKAYYVADSTNIVPLGISVFAHGTILKDKLKGFARFDYYDPDTKYDSSRTYSDKGMYYKENFITFGLDYTPHSSLHIMPNIWINTFTDKRNTKIDRSADVVARFTFWYIFK